MSIDNFINKYINKMSNIEHPKSAVNRIISQYYSQHPTFKINISEPFFSHVYKKIGNKNIYKCFIDLECDGKMYNYVSNEYLTKKEAEKNVYLYILEFLENKIFDQNKNKNSNSNCYTYDNYSSNTNTSRNNISINNTSINNTPINNAPINNTPINNTSINKVVNTNNELNKYKNLIDSPMKHNNSLHNILINKLTQNIKILIIVDYENISKSAEIIKLTNLKKDNMEIIKVTGYCSSANLKKEADIVVRSNGKDAVDHYISFMVGYIKAICDVKIYIITRDSFGSRLQDFSDNIIHCSDVDDFRHIANNDNN